MHLHAYIYIFISLQLGCISAYWNSFTGVNCIVIEPIIANINDIARKWIFFISLHMSLLPFHCSFASMCIVEAGNYIYCLSKMSFFWKPRLMYNNILNVNIFSSHANCNIEKCCLEKGLILHVLFVRPEFECINGIN